MSRKVESVKRGGCSYNDRSASCAVVYRNYSFFKDTLVALFRCGGVVGASLWGENRRSNRGLYLADWLLFYRSHGSPESPVRNGNLHLQVAAESIGSGIEFPRALSI